MVLKCASGSVSPGSLVAGYLGNKKVNRLHSKVVGMTRYCKACKKFISDLVGNNRVQISLEVIIKARMVIIGHHKAGRSEWLTWSAATEELS